MKIKQTDEHNKFEKQSMFEMVVPCMGSRW